MYEYRVTADGSIVGPTNGCTYTTRDGSACGRDACTVSPPRCHHHLLADNLTVR